MMPPGIAQIHKDVGGELRSMLMMSTIDYLSNRVLQGCTIESVTQPCQGHMIRCCMSFLRPLETQQHVPFTSPVSSRCAQRRLYSRTITNCAEERLFCLQSPCLAVVSCSPPRGAKQCPGLFLVHLVISSNWEENFTRSHASNL